MKHELTQKLLSGAYGGEAEYDSIIREFLSQKAKELESKAYASKLGRTGVIREILGVSGEETCDRTMETGNPDHRCHKCTPNSMPSGGNWTSSSGWSEAGPPPVPESLKGQWCEHMKFDCSCPLEDKWVLMKAISHWQYCPGCAAPRPKVKTRREIAKQAMDMEMDGNDRWSRYSVLDAILSALGTEV